VAPKEQAQSGGEGGSASAVFDRAPGGRKRASLQMIERAARQGWKIPQEWLDSLPQVAAQIAADPKAPRRDRMRALQVLRAMEKDKTDAAQALEHIERLDRGDPTEIVVNREQLTFD
jgi:hypothetical protein